MGQQTAQTKNVYFLPLQDQQKLISEVSDDVIPLAVRKPQVGVRFNISQMENVSSIICLYPKYYLLSFRMDNSFKNQSLCVRRPVFLIFS